MIVGKIKSVMPQEASEENNSLQSLPMWVQILFIVYIFLSYFETYLVPFIGNSTKFIMLGIILLFIYVNHWKLKLNRIGESFFIWFVFLCITIIWSRHVNNTPQLHFLTLLGNVLFLFVVSGMSFDESFIRLNLQGHYWVSFLFGALSVIFHKSYTSEIFVARQVLTLFGQQNDPNNCAAFLVIGIALALYSVIYEKEKIWLNLFVILVNGYAILLTASRAGFINIGLLVIVFILLPNQESRINVSDMIKKLVFIFVGIALISYLGYKILPQASLDRLISFDEYSGGTGRTEKWEYAIDLIKQRPLFGWGWGGYSFASFGATHNTFLTIWCDAGIVGLLLFVIPLIDMCISALRKRNVLVILFLICGLFPSFLIDAINKRFLWNAIIISIMLINYRQAIGVNVSMWEK